MIVRYDDNINKWDVGYLARKFCEAFRSNPSERRAPICQDWVEKRAQPRWELYQVTCMTEPGCAQFMDAMPLGNEIWLVNRNLGKTSMSYS